MIHEITCGKYEITILNIKLVRKQITYFLILLYRYFVRNYYRTGQRNGKETSQQKNYWLASEWGDRGSESPASCTTFSRLPYVCAPLPPDSETRV